MEHLIHLNGYRAVPDEEGTLKLGTKDSYGIETLRIDADSAWDGLIVTAVFVAGNSRTKSVLKSNNIIVVPPEATAVSTHITLNRIVFSGEKNGVRRVTCDLPYVVCNNSGYDGNNSIDPTPSEYAQFVAQVKDNADRAEAAATKIPDPDGKTDKILTVQNGKYVIDDPLRINDDAINREDVWSSKQVVDTFAPEFKVTGNPVTCDPVPNYPLSITVKGKTTQEGSGDPSPANVRPLSGVGRKMVELVLDSSLGWSKSTSPQISPYFGATIAIAPNSGENMEVAQANQFCTAAAINNADGNSDEVAWAFVSGGKAYVRARIGNAQSAEEFGALLDVRKNSGNPVVLYYVPADESQATGWYTWGAVDGDTYAAVGLPLNGLLYDGDSVSNDVPSGCDVEFILDGTIDFRAQQESTNGIINFIYTDPAFSGVVKWHSDRLPPSTESIAITTTENIRFESGSLYLRISSDSLKEYGYTSLTDAAAALKKYLQSDPIYVVYRSANYTPKNDIRAETETHGDILYTLTGEEVYTATGEGWALGAVSISKFMVGAVPVEGYASKAGIICSHLATKTPADVTNLGHQGCAQGSGTSLYLNFGDPYNTKELAVQYIKDQYAAGTPVQIKAKRAIPAVYARPAVVLPAPEGTVTVKAENTCDVTGRQTAQAAYNQLLSMVTAMQTHITGV